jgi:hypothetical protein
VPGGDDVQGLAGAGEAAVAEVAGAAAVARGGRAGAHPWPPGPLRRQVPAQKMEGRRTRATAEPAELQRPAREEPGLYSGRAIRSRRRWAAGEVGAGRRRRRREVDATAAAGAGTMRWAAERKRLCAEWCGGRRGSSGSH